MRYFIDKEEKKISISTFQKKLEEKLLDSRHFLQDEKDVRICEYLKELFGDIELDEDLIKVFIKCFSSFGGRYLVRSEDDTLKGLLSFKKTYPTLSAKAIDEIAYYYIKDLFDEYQLESILTYFIEKYGETDLALEKYLETVDLVAKQYQKKYEQDAKSISYLEHEYDKGLTEYLQTQIKYKHISKDEILKHLPEKELVKKDEEQLLEFATRTRIHFGLCYPLSYSLIVAMTKDEELSAYPEELKYSSSFGQEMPLTFTKSEFIESTKRKQKRI